MRTIQEIDLNKCKPGDILICKHGVIKQYIKKADPEDFYDHHVKYLYVPYESTISLERRYVSEGFVNFYETICDDGGVFKTNKLDGDTDVIKVIDREVFKRYLRMLINKL